MIAFGNYILDEQIGSGVSSRVFKCRRNDGTGPFAIKILSQCSGDSDQETERFIREIKTLIMLNHSNVIRILDYGKTDDSLFFVSEFVHGDQLSRVIRQYTWIPEEKAAIILGQLCEALAVVHSKNIVHRDLKPANILVTGKGIVKLIDFGICKDFSDLSLSSPGGIMGTISYMAPEQIEGCQVDARSDIFSLGVILYEMLFGANLLDARSPSEYREMIQKGMHLKAVLTSPSLSSGIKELLCKMLAVNPTDRYSDTRKILRDLKSALDRRQTPKSIIDFVKTLPFFADLTPSEINEVAGISRIRDFSKGETIVEEGTLGRELFFIMRGELEVIKRVPSGDASNQQLALLEEKMIFGEISFFEENMPMRSASVMAMGDGRVITLTYQALKDIEHRFPELMGKVYKAVTKILINRLKLTSERLAFTRLTLKNFSTLI
ncbi:MAG: hypothetical protein CVV64_08110 [Candidatus Wallbacteria bacterium HGW-Wallbacteria-1]|jgi:serine/threonine-protein kinase|uniref:Uncharacterized protein n=1 Tax=Candidatus Wallbacteria bacterium HGW-Wallbacteria-1 TaxID=2013854 RepID=A0A2N1PR72_9BACT|nr:MAG: hypothetical protein CVV64_08110 [Candidatus Wallbacteria bacterium HGW-Wallbacteria-1]